MGTLCEAHGMALGQHDHSLLTVEGRILGVTAKLKSSLTQAL